MDKIEFITMVNTIANIMEVRSTDVKIKNIKTKWGECTSDGIILFNSNLLDKNINNIRQVIIQNLRV